LIASFLALRWYLSKSSPTNATPGAPGTRAAATRRVNPASIDQVAEMLPQLDRRDIAWDLQGNGGNVAATIERGLSGRGLVRVR
jgi:coupling of ubiquitin conjugation to ER degradation protein 1